jgi:hypothetical protein
MMVREWYSGFGLCSWQAVTTFAARPGSGSLCGQKTPLADIGGGHLAAALHLPAMDDPVRYDGGYDPLPDTSGKDEHAEKVFWRFFIATTRQVQAQGPDPAMAVKYFPAKIFPGNSRHRGTRVSGKRKRCLRVKTGS